MPSRRRPRDLEYHGWMLQDSAGRVLENTFSRTRELCRRKAGLLSGLTPVKVRFTVNVVR